MKLRVLLPAGVFLLGCCLSLSLFLLLWLQAPRLSILDHSLRLSFSSFALSLLVAAAITLALWWGGGILLSQLVGLPFAEALAANLPSLLPLLFFSLSPLALRHFLTSRDLSSRLLIQAGAILVAILFIQFFIIKEKGKGRGQSLWPGFRFFQRSPRKKALVLFLIAFLLYGLGALILQKRGVTFSGDEPHYLLITYSLLFDLDFDLANNYLHRDYERYMIPGVVIKPHTVPGTREGSQLSFHSPGISFLLLPFYALGSKLGGFALPLLVRLGMALFGALLGVQLFLFARERGGDEFLALRLWALFSFTVPVFFYSIHVYPEIVASLLSFLIFRWLARPLLPSSKHLAWSGLGLSLLLWFHSLKYLFLIFPLLIFGLWVIKEKRLGRKNLLLFLGPFFGGTAGYFWFQQALYGSFNPTAISWQGAMSGKESLGFLKTVFFSIPFRFRWETLAGYFLDQRDGLLFYAPIYLLAFVGLIVMLRERPKQALLLLLLTWPYFLNSAFLTQRAGYAPQARPLVASFWGIGLLLGYFFLSNRKKFLACFTAGAAFLSFLNVILLLLYPLNLYQETTVGTTERGGGLFYLLSNLHFSLPSVLPSFLKVEGSRWIPNFIWIGLLLLFLLFCWLPYDVKKIPELKVKTCTICAALFLIFFWLVYYPRLVLLKPMRTGWPERQSIVFYSLSRVARLTERGTFALPQDNRPYHFLFTAREELAAIDVRLSFPGGTIPCQLAMFEIPFFQGKMRQDSRSLTIAQPPAYRRGKEYLYWLTIELGPSQGVVISQSPLLFSFTLRAK